MPSQTLHMHEYRLAPCRLGSFSLQLISVVIYVVRFTLVYLLYYIQISIG